jgi:two-component system OmpR family sensor kinase
MRSLRGRLALFYSLTLALVLAAFSAAVYVVVEVISDAGEPPEVEAAEHTGRHLLLTLAAALPIAVAAGVAGTLVVTRRALAPLDEVVRTAERLSAQELSLRVPAPPDMVDEVATLVRALNAMLARLERSVDGMRRFTADAAHELRTPIAALMGELEVTLRHPRSADELRALSESALEELGRWSRLVDSLLVLARSDASGLGINAKPLDLGDVVRRAVESCEPLFAAREVTLSCAPIGAVAARLDPLWLARILANLLDNAAKFTPPGGRVAVDVRAAAQRVQISVDDTAPPLGEEERARVFERFYRGEAARARSDGFGLGLSLAREMARAMGGDVRCQPGGAGGNCFVLELPAEAAPR